MTLNRIIWALVILQSLSMLILVLSLLLAKPIIRRIIEKSANHAFSLLFSDKYTQNLSEGLIAEKRVSAQNIIEFGLRAEQGKILGRPVGPTKHYPGFENLMFVPPQIRSISLPESTQINMQATIGPKAQKPLKIGIPLMISAMAYGIALSEEAKRALARAANILQTTTCSGEGPFLPEERAEAGKYVLQISRWSWGSRNYGQIASADMLEVQLGQGADAGAVRIEAAEFAGRAQVLGGLAPGQPAISYPAPPGIQSTGDWPDFMKSLRQRANGVPIGLKMMATGRIEDELKVAIDLGFDAVLFDGAQGGSHASTPLKQDDFGLPTLNALVRAERFLQAQGARDRMSLIIAGGFYTPGACLKALALGADAVALATVPLFALTHNQLPKVLPFEPPTTLVFYDSPDKTKLNIDQAATSVVNVMTSMVLEMEEAMRALGRASLQELTPNDLVSLDSITAEITGVKRVY